ncbi:O-antigen ligase family protein [Microbacteriaceae bacterium VKM Ac-2855]|nr:O-antigen ligase family protein [Microbacteriaceae bacterium VKM Ac-2855]
MSPLRSGAGADAFTATVSSPRFAAVLAQVIIGVVLCAPAIRGLIGWPGYIAAVTGLVALGAIALLLRRATLDWHGILPVSLLVFLGWSALSVVWSGYQWATVAGVAYQFAIAFLGVTVALTRDIIQIVRAFGDVLRLVLGLSIAVEIVAGILIDQPIRFLQIDGSLALGGPIQGIEGTRNQLGLVCLIALATFVVELLTKSVPRGLAVASLVVAATTLLFTRSAVSLGVLVVVLVAAAALRWVRRATAEQQRTRQIVTVVVFALTGSAAWLLRGRIIEQFNAGSEFEYRIVLWQRLWQMTPDSPILGRGWIGLWRRELYPFNAIDYLSGRPHASALNALFDVVLQLGLVGAVIFVILVGLALVRSWLIASARKAVVHVWPVLILAVLVVTSFAESAILVDFGWLLLVICTLRAAQGLSWRRMLRAAP